MPDYYAEHERLTADLPTLRGGALLARLDALVALADAHADGEAQVQWRLGLLHAASEAGDFARELRAFDGLRRLSDADPADARLRAQVLWYYKWVLERVPEFAEVPKAQVDALFEQMRAAYAAAGSALGAVHALRCRTAALMGDKEAADQHRAQWLEAGEATADDCPACQTDTTVQYLLATGRMPEALDAARPLLEGEQACSEVPAVTFARLLVPMLIAGRGAEAEHVRLFTQRQVRRTPKLAGHLADHVLFLVFTGRERAALRPLAVALARAAETGNAQVRFEVYRAAWATFARLAVSGETTARLPRRAGAPDEAVPALVVWSAHKAAEAAAALDGRNGNDRFEGRLRSLREIVANLPAGDDAGRA